jgi:hypothetical protein
MEHAGARRSKGAEFLIEPKMVVLDVIIMADIAVPETKENPKRDRR